MSVLISRHGKVSIITIDRPGRRNAVDPDTARLLDEAFEAFDRDAGLHVAVLTGAEGNFCAGADLQALADDEDTAGRVARDRPGPMGPTRRRLGKPVIAAVEGHAVAGGLELACWCDLRVAARSAVFGVFCRRFGVPLVDGGTVRLPRLIGQSRALDMILTGRAVDAAEALDFGLVNRLVDDGRALDSAIELAESLAALPQACLRNDRESALRQWGLDEPTALRLESELGLASLATGEAEEGATLFARGAGRGGEPTT
jgi:enoyl-CoA hydratase